MAAECCVPETSKQKVGGGGKGDRGPHANWTVLGSSELETSGLACKGHGIEVVGKLLEDRKAQHRLLRRC
jgi:hypothetical protein